MKKELPDSIKWVALGVGVLVIGGVAFFAMGGGGNKPTADEQKVIEMQADVARSRSEGYASGGGRPGGPPAAPGQGSGEFEARQNSGQ